jgi:putative ABC transport system substrate-binding protein
MRRRRFIAIAGAAALAVPTSTRGQTARLPVIGFMNSTSEAGYKHRIAAFRRGLAEAGFVEGKSVVIEFQHANGEYDRLPAIAAELVARRPAVIVAAGGTATAALRAATTTIPIVFSMSSNPVELGYVASLARPGGNVTGTTRLNVEVSGKRMQLLKEIAPTAKDIALLVNPKNFAITEPIVRDSEAAALKLKLNLHVVKASSEKEIDGAFSTIIQGPARALIVSPDAFFNSQVRQVAELAIRHGVPTIGTDLEFVTAGGLMSYGGSLDDGYRIVGEMTARILNGARPADLAVQQSTRLQMALNLRTAKAIGLVIPPLVLAQADEVIE